MRRFAKNPLKQFTDNGFQPHNGLLDPFFYKVCARTRTHIHTD